MISVINYPAFFSFIIFVIVLINKKYTYNAEVNLWMYFYFHHKLVFLIDQY